MAAPAPVGRPGGHDLRPRPLLRTTIGDVLRRARLLQGRTLADVARIARVSMPYLSELERGRKEASSEVLAAICDALGIDLADLLAEVRRELLARRGRAPAARLGFQPQAAPPTAAGLGEAAPGQAGPSQSDTVASEDEAVLLLGDQSVLLLAGGTGGSSATSPRSGGQAVCQLAA